MTVAVPSGAGQDPAYRPAGRLFSNLPTRVSCAASAERKRIDPTQPNLPFAPGERPVAVRNRRKILATGNRGLGYYDRSKGGEDPWVQPEGPATSLLSGRGAPMSPHRADQSAVPPGAAESPGPARPGERARRRQL